MSTKAHSPANSESESGPQTKLEFWAPLFFPPRKCTLVFLFHYVCSSGPRSGENPTTWLARILLFLFPQVLVPESWGSLFDFVGEEVLGQLSPVLIS